MRAFFLTFADRPSSIPSNREFTVSDRLKSAQERGHVTELELALLFPDEEREDPSERMLNAGAYVLGFMDLMGIKFLNSHTMDWLRTIYTQVPVNNFKLVGLVIN